LIKAGIMPGKKLACGKAFVISPIFL